MHAAPECLVVAVHTRKDLDPALDEAVDLLKPAAVAGQVGISVTRLAPGRYEARLAGMSGSRRNVSGAPAGNVFHLV